MSEKLEAMLQAVIDAETDTAYHYASESLTEAAPEILALIKARTPAPEGVVQTDPPVVPAPEGEAVAWQARQIGTDVWVPLDHYTSTAPYEMRPLYASPVVPVGVSREEIAAIIMKTARLDLIAGFPPIGQIDNPQKIADAIIAALRPTDTGREG
jgi:hypothetical protein